MITQQELKEILHYDPETGIFVSLMNRSNIKIDDVLGSLTSKGYLRIKINCRHYSLHRLAFLYMEGYMPVEVDHKNRIRDDNKWENLRGATALENNHNSSRNNPVIGVSWNKEIEKWKVYGIQQADKGGRIHLGYYTNYNDAVIVRKMWEYNNGYITL